MPLAGPSHIRSNGNGIILTIIIGFVAGIVAKFIMLGNNEPSGFYNDHDSRHRGGAGLLGAIVGAVIVLFVWGFS